jgi:hypothetical protein
VFSFVYLAFNDISITYKKKIVVVNEDFVKMVDQNLDCAGETHC